MCNESALQHMRFFAWMLDQQDGGFHVTAKKICERFNVHRNTASSWRLAYFAARGMFPMRPLPRVE